MVLLLSDQVSAHIQYRRAEAKALPQAYLECTVTLYRLELSHSPALFGPASMTQGPCTLPKYHNAVLLLLAFAPPSVVERHSPDLCCLFLISVLYSFVSRLFSQKWDCRQSTCWSLFYQSQGWKKATMKMMKVMKAENEKDED